MATRKEVGFDKIISTVSRDRIGKYSMDKFIYFKPKDLRNYLRSLKGVFRTQDYEILIVLTIRKAYEDKFLNGEEMLIGFQLKPGAEIDLPKNGVVSTNEVGQTISKYSLVSTLTDTAIGKLKNGMIASNPIRLQIKRYGLGKQAQGGTEELINLLLRHKTDAASDERLILYLEENRGNFDIDELMRRVDMTTFPYKEVITVHYTKPDMTMHFIQLKSSQSGKYGYKSFTQEEIITL